MASTLEQARARLRCGVPSFPHAHNSNLSFQRHESKDYVPEDSMPSFGQSEGTSSRRLFTRDDKLYASNIGIHVISRIKDIKIMDCDSVAFPGRPVVLKKNPRLGECQDPPRAPQTIPRGRPTLRVASSLLSAAGSGDAVDRYEITPNKQPDSQIVIINYWEQLSEVRGVT